MPSAEQKRSRVRALTTAQPVVAAQVVAPCARFVAIEDAQERFATAAGKDRLDFVRERQHTFRAPLRQHAGMHHQQVSVDDRKGPMREPVGQFVAVRRFENRRQRVIPMRVAVPRCDGQQVEIVIAEHGHRGVAQRFNLAQHAERVRSAIDEVAGQPQPVGGRREADQRQQVAELGMTALDVADRVVRHEKRSMERAKDFTHVGTIGRQL